MRKTFYATLLAVAAASLSAGASATTITFNGTITNNQLASPPTANKNGSFASDVESGYTIATNNKNSFTYMSTGGDPGAYIEGGAGNGTVGMNNTGTVYITSNGGGEESVSSFDVYFDGTDTITFNVEGGNKVLSNPTDGTKINTSFYTCNIHGQNCKDELSSTSTGVSGAGWYLVTLPTNDYTDFSIQLTMPNSAGSATDGLDNIVITPEPGSLALLGTGLVGVAGFIRRRVRMA